MKRVLSFFLCLALLCSTVMLLASCSKGKDGEPKVSSKVVDVDLTDYSVIYASDLSSDGRSQVNDMATQLSALTALKIRPNIDGESDAVKTDDLEILIGETNRSETVKTLKSLGDLGWAIRVFDNKIVIVGTNNFMTRVALAYFTRNYLNTDSVKSTVLSLNKKVTAAKLESLSFTDEEGLAAYSVIFDDRLDITTGSDYGSEPAGATVDYPFTVVEQVRSNLASLTGLRANNFAIQNDTVAATEKEILVGDLDRTEMQEVLADMSAKDYGIVIRNSKIMVAAWNDVTLARAAALFKSMLTDATEADEEGNTTTLIPTNCSMVLTMTSDWVTDFPRPEGEGITLSGTVDVNDNSIEYVYSGTGINRDSYVAYCQTLEAAGFKTIAAETQMEGSSFRTYLNENTGVTLQVSHYAYTHAASQKVTNFENCFRIVASTTEDVTLPSADILSPKSYTYMTETMVTSVAIQYRTDIFGMCYIITLEDGSFLIFDGGKGGELCDYSEVWKILESLYKSMPGREEGPTKDDPIHISGWILTHGHGDHYNTVVQFLKNYGKSGKLKVDTLFANYASDTELVNVYNPNTYTQDNLTSIQGYVNGGFDYVKVHTGQVFYIANAKLEVLYTHEDIYPQRLEYFNNTSTIFRITTENTEDRGMTLSRASGVWLGDLERIGSKCLRAMWGTSLSGASYAATYGDGKTLTQMVQVAHHGYNGVEAALYNLIEAEVVWAPTNQYMSSGKTRYQNSFCNSTSTNYSVQANYAAAHGVNVKMFILADKWHTTLKFSGSGPLYDDMFDAVTNEAAIPDGVYIVDSRSAA